jgi:peptidoglycan/xylan/chitin deacetylase (PgdA/CDA1 family)
MQFWISRFDDGPSLAVSRRQANMKQITMLSITDTYTQVLDCLADKNPKATFYVIGANIVNHPEILQATDFAGHEVSLSH